MKRGFYDVTGEILEEALRSPNVAPTRIMARTSATYPMLKPIVAAGLLEFQKVSKRRNRLRMTEKGRLFLQHYKVLKQLFPCPL
jgi:predicted transcriptional regulator